MKNNLKAIREQKGMSQFELSIASHTPQSLLSMMEHGRLQPWPAVTKRLCKALGVKPEELFPEGEPCEASR